MNCKTIELQLLNCETPGQPSATVQAHLDRCPACRILQRRLLQMERCVPLLPVSASGGKAILLDRLLNPSPPALAKRTQTTPDRPAFLNPRSAIFRLAAGLAAAAVLLAVALWAFRQAPGDVDQTTERPLADTGSLLAILMQRDLRLAAAETPPERVQTLAELADDLHGESRVLAQAAAAEELVQLAHLYDQVVRNGIVPQAQAVPAAQRRQVLDPIAERLGQAGADAERLAREAPALSAAPLRDMAAAARDGGRRLRALLQETPS